MSKINKKLFLKVFVLIFGITILVCGFLAKAQNELQIQSVSHEDRDNFVSPDEKDLVLRFVVAGDGHWSRINKKVEPGHYIDRYKLLLANMKREKEEKGLDFFILNGDLIHHNPDDLVKIKIILEKSNLEYYVTYGNHERASQKIWNILWGEKNFTFTKGDYAFICPTTSNSRGVYLPIDGKWLQKKIDKYAKKKGLFVIAHIPQDQLVSPEGVDAPKVRGIFEATPNLAMVIYSHLHDCDYVYELNGVTYGLTGHFGHSGNPYYSYRIVEVYENFEGIKIETYLYSMTDNRPLNYYKLKIPKI